MDPKKEPQPIDLVEIFQVLFKQRLCIAKICGIVSVVAVIYVCSIPRGYNATVTLAPEISSGASLSGNIGSLASMVGLNLGSSMNGDALYPEIYPDVLNSTDFLVSLFDVKVQTADGEIKTTLYDYFAVHQERPWWSAGFSYINSFIKSIFPKKEEQVNSEGTDSFWLTEDESNICKMISDNISCSVDKKTSVITIGFTAQDALVAATMTDSVKQRLQDFIIEYKTSKARNDLVYFEKMLNESQKDYEAAQRVYSEYCDTHKGAVLQSYMSQQDFLENQLQLSYTSYSQWVQQVQIAKAKLQEKTPSFSGVISVTVPLRPSSPKRMLIVVGCVFFAFLCSSLYVYGREQMLKKKELKMPE